MKMIMIFCNLWKACLSGPKTQFFIHNGYLFRGKQLCIPDCSLREVIIRKAHGGGLVISVNLLAFLAYFSRVLHKLNARFTLISLKNALIPHLNVFCRVIMKTKQKDGKSEENKKLLNYYRWFVATKVVFVTTKQTSDNRICYGLVATKQGNSMNMLRVCHDESPFVATKAHCPTTHTTQFNKFLKTYIKGDMP